MMQRLQHEIDTVDVFLIFSQRIVSHKAHDFLKQIKAVSNTNSNINSFSNITIAFSSKKALDVNSCVCLQNRKVHLPMKQLTAKLVSSLFSNFNRDVLMGDLLNFTISAYSFQVHSTQEVSKTNKISFINWSNRTLPKRSSCFTTIL